MSNKKSKSKKQLISEETQYKSHLDNTDNIPQKAKLIAERFKNDGLNADPYTIANFFGFKNSMEMNLYMKNNNMFFNSNTKTYETNSSTTERFSQFIPNDSYSEINTSFNYDTFSKAEYNKYAIFLKYLYDNKEYLINLCTPSASANILQHYIIQDEKKIKSIYLSKYLSALINDFAHSNKITISELVQNAIIEYLIKYGYKTEVTNLLNKK